ncbi:MAG: hypothetical protein QM805_29155 [Pseudomonas sp.]
MHADFALSEVIYFHGILGSAESASLAYDNYLIGHARGSSKPKASAC